MFSGGHATSATNEQTVKNAKKRLTKFLKTLDTLPVEELRRSAIVIKNNAVAQTPYRSGQLAASVYVNVSADKRRPGLVAGASARHRGYNYAGIQHRSITYHHLIGKYHYISDPFNAEVTQLKKRLRKGLKLRK